MTVADLRECVDASRMYAYPDVVVACEPHQYRNDGKGAKRHRYQTIPSLQEYAVVSQTEPRVEIYRRGPGSDWTVSNYAGPNEVCEFRGLPVGPVRVALADIYERIAFDPPVDL